MGDGTTDRSSCSKEGERPGPYASGAEHGGDQCGAEDAPTASAQLAAGSRRVRTGPGSDRTASTPAASASNPRENPVGAGDGGDAEERDGREHELTVPMVWDVRIEKTRARVGTRVLVGG